MSDIKKLMIPDLLAVKDGKEISMITAYSFPQALGRHQHHHSWRQPRDGERDAGPVTMEEMLESHQGGARRAWWDMPFMSYNIYLDEAIRTKHRGAVKLEGGPAPAAAAIVKAGFPCSGTSGSPRTSGRKLRASR